MPINRKTLRKNPLLYKVRGNAHLIIGYSLTIQKHSRNDFSKISLIETLVADLESLPLSRRNDFSKISLIQSKRLPFQSLLKWAHILSFDTPKGLLPRLSPGKQQGPGLPHPGVHLPDGCSFQPELIIYSELSKNSY
jgi:hypothetical protein